MPPRPPRVFALLLLALPIAVAGCKGDEASQSARADAGDAVALGTINDRCPVMGGSVNPDAPTAIYAGSRIGFCCAGCIRAWEKMADDQKQAFVAAQPR